MRNIFTEHPESVGESYFQHMKHASRYGFNMIFGGIACLLHAVFPFMFKRTGSNVLIKMTQHFVSRMPYVEDRVICIADTIDEKMQTQQSV